MGKQWHPLERGFAEFEGFYDHTTTAYFEYDLDVGGEVAHFDSDYLTQDLSKRAIDFVRRHRAEPFFLHLAHYAPHRPLEAPRALVQSYLDRGLEANTATIYAMIEMMDQGIGELVDELDALGLRDDTIIIFASDNGPDPLTGERFNFGVRGTKYQIYEGGIRVPFLISWRNPLKSRTEDAIVHFSDVFPTLVDLCDLAAPTGYQLDGQSLTELLKEGGKLAGIQRFWQWNRGAPNYTHNATMRKGDWKLVRPYVTRSDDPSDSAEPAALYNLKTDPMETTNLAATHRERYSDMKEKLEAWSKEVEQSRLR